MSSQDDRTDDGVVARSFVARALLEPDAAGSNRRRWFGFVTDAESGARRRWRRSEDVARFIDAQLAADPAGAGALLGAGDADPLAAVAMSTPSLNDVVADMLAVLGARLPAPGPATVPAANVTLETVAEKLAGLGNQRGLETTGGLGMRSLLAGRLDARVRFQVWATGPAEVDAAMQSLHTAMLDGVADLRAAGFLRLSAAGTTLAEEIVTIPAWRKAASYDVLYEYHYDADDDASSLIARIPVSTDTAADGSGHEEQTLTDHLVRWDQEGAATLAVRGPAAVSRLAVMAFVPGPAIGGTVTVRRTAGGAPVPAADLDTFLAAAATPGAEVELALAPAALLGALGPLVVGPVLGDWDLDGVTDAYTGAERLVAPPITLPSSADRFEISYTPPAGPGPGLDQTAVVYLRVGAS